MPLRRLTGFRAALLGVIVASIAYGQPIVESFETDLAGWHAEGGSAAVSDEHWKLGTRSLRWDFTPGSKLFRTEDEALRKALEERDAGIYCEARAENGMRNGPEKRNAGIKLWIYCEHPVDGDLQVQVGGRVFPVHLGFTGWRTVWVSLREDTKPTTPIQGMQITAPASPGTLFLDAFEIGPVPWLRQGDAQAPYVNTETAGGKYWFTAHDEAGVKSPPFRTEITEEERKTFRELEARYEAWMFDGIEDPRDPVRLRMKGVENCIVSAHKAFEALGLRRRGEIVTGPGAFGCEDTHEPLLGRNVFREIALGLAYDARLNNSERAKQRFLDLLDYAHDQGWAAGSLMGSGGGESLSLYGYVHGVYIMRDFLRKEGRLARELETLRYHLLFGEMYRPVDHPGENSDDIRSTLLFRYLTILMQDDSPEKVRDMECWVRWVNGALSIAPGYGDCIKPDGTVFHHSTAYANAYGNNAVLMGSIAYWLVRDTRFALSVQVGENLKRALLTLRFMAGSYDFPMGVNGRWPLYSTPSMAQTCQGMAYLADALGDKELGNAFARLWNPGQQIFLPYLSVCGESKAGLLFWCDSPGALPWLLDAAERWKAEPEPQGHRSYPYAAMDFHRRRQWVASVRGWSKYVWHYEELDKDNRYGRYSSYGTVQIFGKGSPVNQLSSGYREAGWDWLRPPGATVIRVPVESLAGSPELQRSYTKDPFVGGVTLEGWDGLWAMRFSDPIYDKSFRFRKSVFFVDETIVCCGSGITNSDSQNPTETVLFQTALAKRPDPFPSSTKEVVTTLMDPVDNGYFFPRPQAVEIRAQRQISPGGSGKTPAEGDFEVAWIDHGTAPKDAGYAYAILPDTTAAKLADYAKVPDFQILQRDEAAHIVRFPSRGITGYTLFAPIHGLAYGELNGTDSPCLVMTRRSGNRLVISMADPDLRLPPRSKRPFDYEPGKTGVVRLFLNGAWREVHAEGGLRLLDKNTLEATTHDGQTYQVTLEAASL